MCFAAVLALAQPASTRQFDLPADEAERALKAFSQQSGRGMVVATATVKGRRTNAVHGRFTAPDALKLMLEGTGLIATYDQKSGGFTITLEAQPSNAKRPSPAEPSPDASKKNDPASFPDLTPMKQTTLRAKLGALFALTLTPAVNAADGAQPAPASETITLSPFEVSSDRGTGYRATNSISATRLDTPLQDVPVNIQVITRDFLDDTLSFRIEEALQYQAGVSLSQQDREQGIFNIRGFTNQRVKRNGFTTYYVHDLGNTERVEVVKGPASLLYGEMDPGGVINYITRRPGPVARHSLQMTVGSYDHYRATLDSSGPIGAGRVRYGLTASWLDDKRWTDDWSVNQRSLNGIVQWAPWRGANVTLEGTTLRRREDLRSQVFIYNKANYDAWLQLPEAQRLAIARSSATDQPSQFVQVNAAGTGLIHSGLRPYWTDVADFLPRRWNTAQGDLDSDMDELALAFETPLGLAHNLRTILRYTETSLLWSSPAGGSNRLGVSRDGLRGGTNSSRLQKNEDLFMQVDFTGKYELRLATLRWVAGWERMDAEFGGTTWQREVGATGIPWIYFNPALARALTATELGGPGGTSPLYPARPLGNAYGRIQSADEQQNNIDSFYGVLQATLLGERLFLMGGLRREASTTEDTIRVGNFVVQPPLVIDNPKDKATVPQVGASFKVVPGVNVFASYSESFRPQRGVGRDIDGTNFKKPPQVGEGADFGVKVGTLNGRFSGTVSHFDITVTDIMGRATPPAGGTQYDIIIDGRKVDGWEFDGVWQEGGNQLTLSYARLSGQGLGSGSGQAIANMPNERFAAWNKYDFTRGALKGAFIAGGYSYTSQRSISSGLGPADIKDGSYGLWDAAIGYNIKIRGSKVEFRLNVKNILNEEYIMGGGLSGYWGDPRLVYLSSRLSF